MNSRKKEEPQKATLKEVARKAGVSIATVSRIINNNGSVKASTREKVLETIKSLNYQPRKNNNFANSDSRIILMCLPDFDNPFNIPVINGAQKSANKHGYNLIFLKATDFSAGNSYMKVLKKCSIAGAIILSSIPRSNLLADLNLRCPVVQCSEYCDDNNISFVSINDVKSAKTATDYLISSGCKKIGMINSSLEHQYARNREKGFRQSMADANLTVNEDWVLHIASINYGLAMSNILHLLSLPDHPDALFVASDVYAVAVVNAAKRLKLKIPEDISVVGFDNIELSTMVEPQITTISQPSFQLGFQAAELLFDKIKNPTTSTKQIILGTELIVRGTTR